jgi:uncharacterized protein (TIGR02271 family)
MTQTQNRTLVGFFEDDADARKAVEALHLAGFTSAHIGVAHRAGSTLRADSSSSSVTEKATSTWDKIKGMFQGNEPESYADERTQSDLANREITQNPADANRSAANQNDQKEQYNQYDTSDLHGSFTGLNIPEQRSRYFQNRLANSRSGAVVTVNAGDRIPEAESILRRYNADLGDNADSYDYSETEAGSSQGVGEAQEQNIQLLGEVLRVHKDRASRGEVRIRKEVITETQTIQVPVTREELVIERRPVDQATPATGSIGESEIRIPLSEERASVDTSTVVREQVAVGKKPVQEVRDLTGEVRREELVVEDPTKDPTKDPSKRAA